MRCACLNSYRRQLNIRGAMLLWLLVIVRCGYSNLHVILGLPIPSTEIIMNRVLFHGLPDQSQFHLLYANYFIVAHYFHTSAYNSPCVWCEVGLRVVALRRVFFSCPSAR